MTCGRVSYVERERRELVFVNYVEVTCSPLSAVDGDALGYMSYFAELIDECAPDADPNETLFRLGQSVVAAAAEGVPVEPLARYFEYWLLRLQGVYPPTVTASDEARAFLASARGCSPFGIADVSVSRKVLRELERSHHALLAGHIEKELKSVRVLKDMRR
jgi:DNA repair protein RecO (recombination protein O)